MQLNVQTYIPGNSPLHRVDARVKIMLLFAFSVALFCVDTWAGLGVALALYAVLHAASRIPIARVARMGIPLYVLVAVAVLFSMVSLNVDALPEPSDSAARMAGAFSTIEPFSVAGTFGINPAGFACGLFNGLRVIILLFASLLVSLSTTSEDIRFAFSSFLSPLRKTKLPIDDASSALSIALRFIPVCADELACVYNAQLSRGAALSGQGALKALKAWICVFIPVFIRLFRRADKLAVAMDARCYGAASPEAASSCERKRLGPREIALLVAGIAAAVALGAAF